MAVTKNDVLSAIEQLESEGQNPTNANIKAMAKGGNFLHSRNVVFKWQMGTINHDRTDPCANLVKNVITLFMMVEMQD